MPRAKSNKTLEEESIKKLNNWVTNNNGQATVLTPLQVSNIKDSVKTIEELAFDYMTSLKAITAIKNGTYELNRLI